MPAKVCVRGKIVFKCAFNIAVPVPILLSESHVVKGAFPMRFFRNLGLTLLSAALVIAAATYAAGLTLSRTAFDPGFYLTTAERSGVLKVIQAELTNLTKNMDDLKIKNSMAKAIEACLDPDLLRSVLAQGLDSLKYCIDHGTLEGSKKVDLSPLKGVFSDTLKKSGFPLDPSIVASEIPSSFSLSEIFSEKDLKPISEGWAMFRKVLTYCLAGAALSCILILLIFRFHRAAFSWIGASLVVAGILIVVLTVAGPTYLWKSLGSEAFTSKPPIPIDVKAVITESIGLLATRLQLVAGGMAAGGVVCLVTASLGKKSTPKKSSDAA